MHEPFEMSDCRPGRFRATFDKFPTHEKQLAAERDYFCSWLHAQRTRRFLGSLVRLWPVAVGIALGFLAPQLHAILDRFEPWGMWLVFPFAVLACRPEFHVASQSGSLPMLILYAQFPIEGMVARLALGRRVTVPGVAGQIFYLHYLAALQLAMIGGAVTQALIR